MTTAPASIPAVVAPDELPPLSAGDRDANPPGIGLLALIREDYRTNGGSIFDQGFWALAVHRFGNYRMGVRFKPFRAPLTVLYNVLFKLVEIAAGISLPYTVRVGRRVRIWHHSGMILHARSIGDDVQIRHNTTFGVASVDRLRAIPTIGDRVDIGCGVCILGWVKVGDDARIGANAVVLSDVPAGATAVGVPARIIRRAPVEAQG
jgi:serine O-acetyltransferase